MAYISKTRIIAVLFALTVVGALAAPVGTLFTYQGKLTSGSNLGNGNYDLQFALYDSATNGTRIGSSITNANIYINDGLFATSLDFGSAAFTNGDARWLQIAVRRHGDPAFTVLDPRQLFTAVPYALNAMTVDRIAADRISGVLPNTLLSSNVSFLDKNQIFTGSNFFQGPINLTNSANAFGGRFFGNGAGLTNLPPFTSILTTNSSFAQIKAAVAIGGLIWFQPGDYWSVDNLHLVDNTVIFGWNAVLHAKAGLTNFLIDENLNAVNISIYGLSVTGDRNLAYCSPDFLQFNPVSPYYQTNLINHSGMRLNLASGGTIAGCSAYGFGGYGFMLFSRNQSSAEAMVAGFFHDNHAYNNGVGVAILGPFFEYLGYPYASLTAWTNNITAEHQLISGNEIFRNGIGLYAPAGNCVIIGNKITANDFGIVLRGGPNNTHGEVIGNTLNHNNYGIIAAGIVGEIIKDNLFLDINFLYFDSLGYAVFDGNQLIGSPGMTITVTNSDPAMSNCVTISHNLYRGKWGTDILVRTNLGTSNGVTYIYGNRSTSHANDTDGSMISTMEIGGGVTTNYKIPGGATLYITNGQIMKIQ